MLVLLVLLVSCVCDWKAVGDCEARAVEYLALIVFGVTGGVVDDVPLPLRSAQNSLKIVYQYKDNSDNCVFMFIRDHETASHLDSSCTS